jgi:general secretion pathway protein A
MARRFAVPVVTDDPGAMLPQIQQCLRHESGHGRQVVLIIDEAQDLPLETLAQLPLLATVPPSGESPLQIVLVGEPALLQHLRRRALRHVAPHIGSHATLEPLTEAESLAYIRQRVARVALRGGPIFAPGALTALVRHAHGVPRDLNRLCTTVLQAGYWAQQQPITADLVQQILAASRGSPPWWRGRLGLTAAGLVLVVGLLGVALFSAGLPASRSHPAARAHSWMEARRPTSIPRLVAPRPQQPEVASQVRTEPSPVGSVGYDPGEGHVRLGSWESLERQRLETPSVTLPPPPPATLMGTALKSCDELKAEIQAKLDAKSLTGYALTIMASGEAQGHQIVGSCEGSTKKIALSRARNTP